MRRALLPLLVVAVPSLAVAQAPPAPSSTAPATVTAGARLRFEAWDWFDVPDAEDRYELVGAQLRFGVQQQRPRLGWQVELAVPAVLGLPEDATAAAPQGQLGLGAAYHAATDFDVDGWPGLDVGVAYGAVTLRDRPDAVRDARLFALHYYDHRDHAGVVTTDSRPLAARQADRDDMRVTTLGGHWLQAWSGGGTTTDLMLWGAWQLGAWGALDHRAWAAAAEVGLQPGGLPRLRPWLRAGIWHGSGDDDPADDEHGTFFQLLPTPRIHARFPFHDLLNVQDVWGSALLRPHARVSLRTELHALRLAERRDLWYAGGGDVVEGTYPTGTAGRLAYLELDWRY